MGVTRIVTGFNILLLLVVVVSSSTINVLDHTSLRSSVLDHPSSLVMFEAPWCPQCHEGRPILEKTAEEKKDLFVASLNCETKEGTTLCNDEKVEAYPTIRLYRKGKEFVDFMDDITTEKLNKFLDDPEGYPKYAEEEKKKAEAKKIPDKALELNALRVDLNQFQAFVTIEKNVLILYYAHWCPRSNGVIDLVKKYEPQIKKLRMKIATCNCQIESHQEKCREKMSHLPLLEAYFEGGQILNSETFFKDIVDWNDETFEKLLKAISAKSEERMELIQSLRKSSQGEEEGEEGPEEEGEDGGEEGEEGEEEGRREGEREPPAEKPKAGKPKPTEAPKKDEL